PQIKGEDVLDVLRVLDVPGPVEAEIPVEVRHHRRRHGTVGAPERTALDLAHHPERHEDDVEDDGNRPEDAPNDELQHDRRSFPLWPCFEARPSPWARPRLVLVQLTLTVRRWMV